jgi:voltage-gated potassium channel
MFSTGILMKRSQLVSLLGLSGVATSENARARRWGRLLEWPMLGVAIWIMVEWYLGAKGLSPPWLVTLTNWVVWLAFTVEAVVLTRLVDDKLFYLRTNWLNLFIILAGIPVLWGAAPYAAMLRSFRLLIAVQVLINMSGTLRALLARNHLGTTLVVSLIVIVIAGILEAGIDPAVKHPLDGIWWAWVTVTTVGYGDIVPVSAAGKILGAILILLGVGLFSMLTASFSVYFISQKEEEFEEVIEEEIDLNQVQMLEQLQNIEKRLEQLEQALQGVADRLQSK